MSSRTTTVLLCDMHSDETAATGTVYLGFGGRSYTLDVCDKHKGSVDKTFDPIIGVARRVTGTGRVVRAESAKGTDTKAIRAWAAEQGIEINARGRIPAEVVERYSAKV